MTPRTRIALVASSLLLTACVTATAAAAFQVQVGAPIPITGIVTGTKFDVALKNGSHRLAKRVVVTCQFFGADGAPAETGAAYFNNVPAGQSDINSIELTKTGVVRGDCAAR